MKAIGVIVIVLVIGLGVMMYVVTRPPDRELDAQEQAWVTGFETWSARTMRELDRAQVRMTFSSESRNGQLIEPMRSCTASLIQLGDAPELMGRVATLAEDACGRAEHAVAVNDEFGTASLATTKLHLHEAHDRVEVARREMRQALEEAERD